MKKSIFKLVAILIVISLTCINASTIVFAQDDTIVFGKCYNKDGKFYIPVTYNGYSGSEATMSATLTNESGDLIDTFPTNQATAGTVITFSRSFAKLKSGTYYLNVTCEFLFYDPIVKSLKITHKAPAPKVVYKDTYQIITDDGDATQVFKFGFFNASGKKVSIEVYDYDGQLIYGNSVKVKNTNGTCTFKWDYYPSDGGVMISDGTYILKYWVTGQTPKQKKFEVEL